MSVSRIPMAVTKTMRYLILTLSLILGLATSVSATSSVFKGKYRSKPSYSECAKAIEKGVEVGSRENSNRIFFYKDKLYTISASRYALRCTVAEILD